MSTASRLDGLMTSPSLSLPLNDASRYVLMSDNHRGGGSPADDYSINEDVFLRALDHYYKGKFTYIEIGDGDEMWEARDFDEIKKAHARSFLKLGSFYDAEPSRYHLIWGNHNREWKDPRKVARELATVKDPKTGEEKALFPGLRVHEGIVLKDEASGRRILLAHGHQGDLWNDQLWWWGRWFIRHIWKAFQFAGAKDPTSPARNHKRANEMEKRYREWVDSRGVILVAGHTHRPWFPGGEDTVYLNTGSCVHPDGITCIEIESGRVSLVKWSERVSGGKRTGKREVLEGPAELASLFERAGQRARKK